MTETRTLLEVLAESGLKHPELAEEARLHQSTISKAVVGKIPIKRRTAVQILYALNRLRKTRNLPDVAFDEIDWNLAK